MGVNEDRPILTGLLALIGVGLAVGLIAGVSVMLGTRAVGIGGGKAAVHSDARGSLYVPKPEQTTAPSGPSITLGSSTTQASAPSQTPTTGHTKPPRRISLQAGETSVAPMGRIDLTGSYLGGEGAVLNVQKFSNGSWQDFYSISATVTGGTFSTYIQTGTPGVNRFRVIDSDTQKASNEVKVTIG